MTEKYELHSADEIVKDMVAGNDDLAGAKLRECFLAGTLKQVAADVEKKTNSDDNWFNDIEIVSSRGHIQQIYLKTIPFTGTLFAKTLFDSGDGDNPDPTRDLMAWNRVMNYKNLREKEKAQH